MMPEDVTFDERATAKDRQAVYALLHRMRNIEAVKAREATYYAANRGRIRERQRKNHAATKKARNRRRREAYWEGCAQ